MESVEEVAQPLRFDAVEVAKHGRTANTVDFVSMYPSFDQDTLKTRIRDAVAEAWAWQEGRAQEGEVVKLGAQGWVALTAAEAEKPSAEHWAQAQVIELIDFVIDNGYIKRGDIILRQVKGFGMGLACAGQIANLACYPVERDYAATRQPSDVLHNYRFIDDIHTLTGCIPTEKSYGMQYKSTRKREGEVVFLGMEEVWKQTKTGTKFITGMHFRDASYPIKIRRYPAGGSMVTESQRIGVITGQFIRAQRLCSTLQTMKVAVKGIVLAAMRRGYKRRELDRVWGKFLAQWWTAEEVRRGELRSWFRKLTSMVGQTVQRENRGILIAGELEDGSKPMCQFRERCWYKDLACPFAHPTVRSPSIRPNEQEMVIDEAPAVEAQAVEQPAKQQSRDADKEVIPKAQGSIWHATGDGSCLYYCALQNNDPAQAVILRQDLAAYAETHWEAEIPILQITVEQLVEQRASHSSNSCTV